MMNPPSCNELELHVSATNSVAFCYKEYERPVEVLYTSNLLKPKTQKSTLRLHWSLSENMKQFGERHIRGYCR